MDTHKKCQILHPLRFHVVKLTTWKMRVLKGNSGQIPTPTLLWYMTNCKVFYSVQFKPTLYMVNYMQFAKFSDKIPVFALPSTFGISYYQSWKDLNIFFCEKKQIMHSWFLVYFYFNDTEKKYYHFFGEKVISKFVSYFNKLISVLCFRCEQRRTEIGIDCKERKGMGQHIYKSPNNT